MRPFRILADAAGGFVDHNGLTLAASIAFYTSLSLAPLLILALWLAASVSVDAQDQLVAAVAAVAGKDAGQAVSIIVDNASRRPSFGSLAGTAGLGLLIFSASAVFSQLQTALNIIWETGAPKASGSRRMIWNWIRRRLLSIGILAAFTFILIVSLAVSALLVVLLPKSGTAWDIVNQGIGVIVFMLLFAAIFRFLPDAHPTWRETWIGALVTSLLFSIGKYAIGVYLGHTGLAGAYGPAGSLAIVLLWVYYSAILFLFGAELIHAHERHRTAAPHG